jgi:hypothetical protein
MENELYYRAQRNYLIPNIQKVFTDRKAGVSVDTIAIPADAKDNTLCLWEAGGMNKDGWGVAIVISEPDGSVVSRPITFQRQPKPNGKHGLTAVWLDWLVSFATIDKGYTTTLVYKITKLTNLTEFGLDPTPYTKNGALVLTLVAEVTSTWQDTNVDILDISATNKDALVNAAYAAAAKVRIQNCTQTTNMNPWVFGSSVDTTQVAHYEAVDVNSFDKYQIKNISNLSNFIMMTENLCRNLIKKTSIPVRIFFKKTDDGHTINAAIVSELPTKFSKEEVTPKVLYALSCPITERTFVSHAFTQQLPDYKAFLTKMNKKKDIRLLYRGC